MSTSWSANATPEVPLEPTGPSGVARYAKPIVFVVLVLCLAGVYCAFTMPSSVFPQTNFPRV
ncbi:MAG TPA: hypothetical protein VFW73_00905, partial [Lacipirellulaceae bacterium]|nr:hypothetical protein [Lacipirellulaceae bacterium]